MDDALKHIKENITLYIMTVLITGGGSVGSAVFGGDVLEEDFVTEEKYEKHLESEAHHKENARQLEWDNFRKLKEKHQEALDRIDELEKWRRYEEGLRAGMRGR